MCISRRLFYIFLLQAISMQLLLANVGSGQSVREVIIDLQAENESLSDILKLIEAKTDFVFAFDKTIEKRKDKLTLNYQQAALSEVLQEVANELGLDFKQINSTISVSKARKVRPKASAVESETTTIRGKVIDKDTGEPLPGATVKIKGTTQGTITDISGNFYLSATSGETIEVSYIGYKTMEKQLSNLVSDQISFSLESDFVQLKGVVVTGITQGQAKALNQQKNADNIKNVVAADQIGRFPDLNTAEAIQRIPGITISRDQGEGRYVSVRGTPLQYTNISVNGEQIPSAEGDVRYVALDVVPVDQLASIEVSKTLTPDMDGDAIGGSINLITRTAKGDIPDFFGTLAGGYNSLMNDFNGQAQLGYGQRFGKFGVLINGSYFRENRGSDNSELEWGTEDFGSGDEFIIDDLQLRDYEVNRRRIGASTTLDYSFNTSSQIYFKALFNRFTDQEYRRRFRLKPGGYSSRLAANESEFERDLKDRFEAQTIQSYNLGGRHVLGGINLDYEVAYAHSQEEEPDRIDMGFIYQDDTGESEVFDILMDVTDKDAPQWSLQNGLNPEDYDRFIFDGLELTDNLTTDASITTKINLEIPVQWGNLDGSIKTGFKYRNRTKERDNEVQVYDGFDGDLALDQLVGDFEDDDFHKNEYDMGFVPDEDKVEAFVDSNLNSFEINEKDTREESDLGDFEAEEEVIAAYLMAKLNLEKFTFIGGFRFEQTNFDYTANQVVFGYDPVEDDDFYERTDKVANASDYNFFLPNVQVKYSPDQWTNIRAALTYSYARPNFSAALPNQLISRENEEIEQGNPDLQPSSAMNVDLMAERYFSNIGIISGGFFYKRINEFIFNRTSEQSGGEFDGFEVTSPQNGKNANVWGVEVNWQQNFTFLPGPLSNLGIYANYTYTNSEAFIQNRADESQEDEEINLPGQADHVGNLALTYDDGKLQSRIAMYYNGSFLDELLDPGLDRFYADRAQWDFSVSYGVKPGIRVFAEFMNITNARLWYYQGSESRVMQQEYYGWWNRVGVKFDL
ncbi:MAG: TonB-dependent receptor [Cyclobacteriaceae bacterium]|nr:TonB-dependent receptor [Cyclobacteriaceae bacterium HetDA_MAG_MS6]